MQYIPENVKVCTVDCDHDILSLIIGQEVKKVLESVDRKDFLKAKVLVTFDGSIKATLVE